MGWFFRATATPRQKFAVLLFVVPLALGLAGPGVWFVPSHSVSRAGVAVAVVMSGGMVAAFIGLIRSGSLHLPLSTSRLKDAWVLPAIIAVHVWTSYLSLTMTLPRILHLLIGQPVEIVATVSGNRLGRSRLWQKTNLRFEEIRLPIGGSFGMPEDPWSRVKIGDRLRLKGSRSPLGLHVSEIQALDERP